MFIYISMLFLNCCLSSQLHFYSYTVLFFKHLHFSKSTHIYISTISSLFLSFPPLSLSSSHSGIQSLKSRVRNSIITDIRPNQRTFISLQMNVKTWLKCQSERMTQVVNLNECECECKCNEILIKSNGKNFK